MIRYIGEAFESCFNKIQATERLSPEFDLKKKVMQIVKSQKVRTVFFDADGTLYRSETLQFLLYRIFLTLLGESFTQDENQLRQDSRDYSDFRLLLENKLQHARVNLSADDVIGFVEKTMRSIFEARRASMLRPRVLETLQWLKEQSIPCGIATLSSTENLKFKLEMTGIADFFQYTVTGSDVKERKPNPESYLKLAEKMGVDPKHALVVEDSQIGLSAAKAGGFIPLCYLDICRVDKNLRANHCHDPEGQYDRLVNICNEVENLFAGDKYRVKECFLESLARPNFD